jgi:HEAT repeat protein
MSLPDPTFESEDAEYSDEAPPFTIEDEPRPRSWFRLVVGLIAIVGIGVVVYLFWVQRHGIAEVRALATRAMDPTSSLTPVERAAALRKVLAAERLYPALRTQAAQTLGTMGDAEAIPVMLSVIRDTGEVSQTTAVSLGRMAEQGLLAESDIAKARNLIFPQMQASKGVPKAYFAMALALLHDERCIEPLLRGYAEFDQVRRFPGLTPRLVMEFASATRMAELAKNENATVRAFAAEALGEKGSVEGPDTLVGLLNDPDRNVVAVAARSLAKVAPTRAGPELINLMQRQPDMQSDLIVALRDTVGAPAIQLIYDGTEDWALRVRLIQYVRAPPQPGREVPASAPRGVGDPRGADMCDHLFKNHPGEQSKREMGLWCLEELGDPRAGEGLIKVAQEEYTPSRDSIIDGAIRSVGILKVPGAESVLLEMLAAKKGRPATILNALGRLGEPGLGAKIAPFTQCAEDVDVLTGSDCDRETALKALGRLRWPNALKLLEETAERRPDDKVATRIESRDVGSEYRLRDRIAAFDGLALLGDAAASELLTKTIEDVEDDPEVRYMAARALAYSLNDELAAGVLAKLRDGALDAETRAYYATALWQRPNREAVSVLIDLLVDTSTPNEALLALGYAIGEAGNQNVDQGRLRALLQSDSSDRLIPACLAAMMAGDDQTIEQMLRVLEERRGVEAEVSDRYAGPDGHPVFLTPALFESGRIYERLHNADLIARENRARHGWAWQQLMDRMVNGTPSSPNGMSAFEIRERLAADVRSNPNSESRRMAAMALLGMGYRGYVLMLAAEEGQGAEVARRVLAGVR